MPGKSSKKMTQQKLQWKQMEQGGTQEIWWHLKQKNKKKTLSTCKTIETRHT